MIGLMFDEHIVKELTSDREIMEILKPSCGHTIFQDDQVDEKGIFDRLDTEGSTIRVGCNSVGPQQRSYFWHVNDQSYITECDGNLWFRFDTKPRWRIQLISAKMGKSCILCQSKCKKEKPCELYDGWKLVI